MTPSSNDCTVWQTPWECDWVSPRHQLTCDCCCMCGKTVRTISNLNNWRVVSCPILNYWRQSCEDHHSKKFGSIILLLLFFAYLCEHGLMKGSMFLSLCINEPTQCNEYVYLQCKLLQWDGPKQDGHTCNQFLNIAKKMLILLKAIIHLHKKISKKKSSWCRDGSMHECTGWQSTQTRSAMHTVICTP